MEEEDVDVDFDENDNEEDVDIASSNPPCKPPSMRQGVTTRPRSKSISRGLPRPISVQIKA